MLALPRAVLICRKAGTYLAGTHGDRDDSPAAELERTGRICWQINEALKELGTMRSTQVKVASNFQV
jgi:hypothetical protein